ncbi:cytochrome b562 [Actinobacillus vicugnae]|uniref:cytochrome b562 n=1 Tax=Actinobacillus vicugnae TaxID=2573093 RepID=UPI001241D1F6|nr:cytochrome b562 [Actinobacillus vicugnae]
MKKFKRLLATALLVCSSFSFAKGVMMEMFQMKKQMNSFMQAETSEEFQQAAELFLVQAEKAKETMPASLEGDQERFAGYQSAMQEVIDFVKKADEQAKQGNLAQAKEMLNSLDDMKKKYHIEYK